MGMVYRATNLSLNRVYALKVLAPELSSDEVFRERFRREIRTAASLHHAHVVGIHYAGEQDGTLFLVMDYVVGTDLRELLRKHGALEPDRAVELLCQLGSALDAAHARGLVHRDVKPANVLITVRDGLEHAYLTDFGLAKRADTIGGLTQQGAVVGTVDYMAPEQVTGRETDARTDIYALACSFFHMLTGNVPYQRDNSVATLFAHVYDPPPELKGPLADLYPTFGAVIEKGMAKQIEDRHGSAGDFARDASAALRGTRYTGTRVVATGDASLTPPAESEPAQPTARAAEPEPTVRAAEPEPTVRAAQPEPTVRAAEPAPAGATSDPGTPARPPSGPTAAGPGPSPRQPWMRYRWLALIGLIVIAAGAAAAIALSGGSSPPAAVAPGFVSQLRAVPTNRVTGSGTATIRLEGNVAAVTVNTSGLLPAVHFMHIHGGTGNCPPQSAAQVVNGHRFISAAVGDKFYGGVVTSLTQPGRPTTPAVHVDESLYAPGGSVQYRRTITLGPGVADLIREGRATIVVHGISFDGKPAYDDFLGPAAEQNAPALCGALNPAQSMSAAIPGAHGTVYVAALRRYGASTGGPAPALLCHLGAPAGWPATDADERAALRRDSTST
ncbi:MAG: protein kinase [Solirubrobacterales bacterium]|nr:protein kinase [Solirubrobacterales bacterium]